MMLDEIFPKQLITVKLGGSIVIEHIEITSSERNRFFYFLCGIFYFPFNVSSERHGQSVVNEIETTTGGFKPQSPRPTARRSTTQPLRPSMIN